MPKVESNPESNHEEDYYKQAFGAWLKDYRQGQQLSVREMAARFGTDESTISRIESGERALPLQRDTWHYLKELPGLSEEQRLFGGRLSMAAVCGFDFAHEYFDQPPLELDPAKSRITFVKGMKIRLKLVESDLTEDGRCLLLDYLQDAVEIKVGGEIELMQRRKQRRAKYYPSSE